MSHPLRWWREKGVLQTQIASVGLYSIERWDNRTFRVYLDRQPTTYFGTESDLIRAVQRIVNSMESTHVKPKTRKKL